MKRTVLALLITLLACSLAYSGGIMMMGGGVPAAATVGNILSESWEGTADFATPTADHADNTGWTKSIGAGDTIDADSTAVAPPTGGGSQTLLCIKAAANYDAMVRHDIASATIVYVTMYVRVNAHGMTTTGNAINLFEGTDSAFNSAFGVKLRKSATGIDFRGFVGATTIDSVDISTDTWYKIGFKFDNVANTYDFSWDQGTGTWVSVGSGALPDPHKLEISRIKVGDNDNNFTSTNYYDKLEVDNAAYR